MSARSFIAGRPARIARNLAFWTFMAWYMTGSFSPFFPNYLALIFVLLLSYGIPGYINNFWLIPKVLLRKGFLPYAGLFVILLAFTTVTSYYETIWINNFIPGLNYMGSKKDLAMGFHIFPSILILTLLAFGKFMADAIKNERRMEQLETQKLQSELQSLRAQINPHFLFNALNTIYGLARRTDHETADAVIKLSDILRYGLYQCDEEKVGIDREVLFIKQYIDFARLRVHNGNNITLDITTDDQDNQLAPLLLIPLVENAIKHGVEQHAGEAWIHITLSVKDKKLSFLCANSKPTTVQTPSDNGGIGLKNVKRRLELLYPNAHELAIRDEPEQFAVELNLQLS